MADYSMLGSFSTGGASALNGDLLTKLREADQASALFYIDKQLEDITGVDADTGDALDTLGETDKMAIISAQAADLMAKISTFDLASTDTTVFDAVSASTTGDAAVSMLVAKSVGKLKDPHVKNWDDNYPKKS